MKHIPNKIYLNIGCDPKEVQDFSELSEVTWCADKINDSDIEYQRKPIWHDLRKNPNDLPEEVTPCLMVIIKYEGWLPSCRNSLYFGKNEKKMWMVNEKQYECGDEHILAWMEIPEFK